jgi:hypothetical protein
MMIKKRTALYLCVLLLMGNPRQARADLFGGDVAVLSQMLIQSVMQLAKLRALLASAGDQVDLIRQINQGINDSLILLKTIDPNLDPGLYREWTDANDSLRRLTDIYGAVPQSPEAQVQKDTDQEVAEAVAANNAFYKYSQAYDRVGEQIKQGSHNASPGGAQKMTAQALGIVIQILNQNLRAQSTGLKLQAQKLALENRKEKAETKQFVETTENLRASMKAEKVRFELPRF